MFWQIFTYKLQADRLCHTSNLATAVSIAHFNCPSITSYTNGKRRSVGNTSFVSCFVLPVAWLRPVLILAGFAPGRQDWEQGLEMLNTAQTRDRQASLRLGLILKSFGRSS